jgi:hypothetical protein
MATLTPVDHDPFATTTPPPPSAPPPATTPTNSKFTPVDHDPFAPAAVTTPATATPPSSQPGYFSVENQLGPFAHMFGYPQRDPPQSVSQQGQNIVDIARRAADQFPFLGRAFDEAGAKTRLQGTPYEGAGEALGMAGTAGATEALGVGRYLAGQAAPYLGKAMPAGVAAFLANRAAGGVEQGGLAAAGTAGQGGSASDIAKSAEIGGGIGLIAGAGGGAKPSEPAPSTADLEQAAEAKWAPTRNAPVVPDDVANALGTTRLGLQPGERASLSGNFNAKLNDVEREASGTNSLSASDVADFQKALLNATRNSMDRKVANQFSTALDATLGQAKPLVDQARQATNVAKTSSELDDLLRDPASAPTAVQGMLAKKPGFYNSQPGLSDALTQIGQMGQPSVTGDIARGLGRRAAHAAAGYMLGGPIGAVAAGALIKPAGAAVSNRPITNALLAAQHLNATGTPLVKPGLLAPLAPLGALARRGNYAAGASGLY